MIDASLREATPADLSACAKIVNDWIDESDWLPRIHSRAEVEGFFNEGLLKLRSMIVAVYDHQVSGYMTHDEKGMIRALYVGKHLRDAGIGKQFLDEAKVRFPLKVELGVFEANIRARQFYDREGFIEIPEGRLENTEEGIPELLMRWSKAS